LPRAFLAARGRKAGAGRIENFGTQQPMITTTTLQAGPAPALRKRRGYFARLADNPVALSRIFLAPALIYIFGLVGLPFFLSLLYSVTSVTVARQDFTFRWLDNYAAVTHNSAFWQALSNTVLYTVCSQVTVLIMANLLALALVKPFPGKWFVRLLILLPFVAPISLGTLSWLWMLDSTYSVFNYVLQAVGFLDPTERLFWLGQPNLARLSIIMINVWRTLPLATVILLAGLGSIPQDIQDAAQMDGARFWRRHIQITLPLTLPINIVALLFGIMFTTTDMVVIYVLTRGGPMNTTHTLASLAYYTGVTAGDLAQGAATALFLFPLLAAVAVAMLRIARRTEVA
jgi:multiple sugar transport system permease protein